MTDEQKAMLATLRQEASENEDWKHLQFRAFEYSDFCSGLAASVAADGNIDHYWRTFVFVKSSEIFPNQRTFVTFKKNYFDLLKMYLKGIGKFTKGKDDYILTMPNGKYHIGIDEDYNKEVHCYISIYDTFRILPYNLLNFDDEADVVAQKLILMDELVGTEYKDDFEELKKSLLKTVNERKQKREFFEDVLKEEMGDRQYTLTNETYSYKGNMTYTIQVGDASFNMSVPMDNPNFKEIAAKLVELCDLAKG